MYKFLLLLALLSGARSETCSGLGGTCMNYLSCNQLVVSGLCPGSVSQKCCVPSSSVDDFDRHLSQAEGGLFLTGYIPTAYSGVTIATGVDLGQQSKSELQSLLSSTLYRKLEPYIGLKTEQEVHNHGLNEKDLKITLPEAISLDAVFKKKALDRIDPYDNYMSKDGRVVMVSLTHWCYNIFDTVADGKCYHKSCPNYLRDALGDKKGTEADLKSALQSQRQCLLNLGEASWKISRLDLEIKYLS